MTLVSDEMLRLVRESVPVGASLVPIRGMSPHYVSRRGDLETDDLMLLFAVEVDGEELHVYVRC
jgi:hypothetical protein